MPFILSPKIKLDSPGMWGEGKAYTKNNVYSIGSQPPPVHYDSHIINAHSLTHFEAPAHTAKDGKTIESFFDRPEKFFYGRVAVIRLVGSNYRSISNDTYHWEITKEEIVQGLVEIGLTEVPDKLFITTESYFVNEEGFHDPKKVLTLSQNAANFLVECPGFTLYGTSWKSSDYKPGSMERPIHNTLFKQALILENLDLRTVPAGEYFLSALPLPLVGASESPVTPVLFTYDELLLL